MTERLTWLSRSRWPWWVAVVVLVWHVVTALRAGGPVALPDVLGYLSVAQWAAGAGEVLASPVYAPGYGLLLAPVSWVVGGDGQALHTAALILNGVAHAAVVVVTAALMRRLLWFAGGRAARLVAPAALVEHTGAASRARTTSRRVTPKSRRDALPAANESDSATDAGDGSDDDGGADPNNVSVAGADTWALKPTFAYVAAVLFAAAHPPLLAASRIAWPEPLVTLTVLAVALCLAVVAQPGPKLNDERRAQLVSFVAGLCMVAPVIHPRLVVLPLVLVAAVVAFRRLWHLWGDAVLGAVVGALIIGLVYLMTGAWPAAGATVAAFGDILNLPPVALGQVLALGASTLGLGLLGVVFGLRAWLGRGVGSESAPAVPDAEATSAADADAASESNGSAPPALGPVAAFAALGAIALLVVSALALSGSNLVDVVLYGRYLDAFAPLLVCVVLATASAGVVDASLRRVGWWVAGVVGLLVVVAFAVQPGSDSLRGEPRTIMTLALGLPWEIGQAVSSGLSHRLAVAVAGAVALVGLVGALLTSGARSSASAVPTHSSTSGASSRSSASPATRHSSAPSEQTTNGKAFVGVAALVLLFAATSVFGVVRSDRQLGEAGGLAQRQLDVATEIQQLYEERLVGSPTCVGYDTSAEHVPRYVTPVYQLGLSEFEHQRLDFEYWTAVPVGTDVDADPDTSEADEVGGDGELGDDFLVDDPSSCSVVIVADTEQAPPTDGERSEQLEWQFSWRTNCYAEAIYTDESGLWSVWLIADIDVRQTLCPLV